jgi:hypothetical protein
MQIVRFLVTIHLMQHGGTSMTSLSRMAAMQAKAAKSTWDKQ